MKKSKLLFAALSATVFAVSAGALVACADEVELPNGTKVGGVREVTFDANDGVFGESTRVTVKTDEKGHIATAPAAPTYNGYTFNGYNFQKDGKGEKITFGENGTVFAIDVTVYAQWTKKTEPEPPGPIVTPPVTTEYEITFHGGEHGMIGGEVNGTATATTVDGKLSVTDLPEVEPVSGWVFGGWMLQDETPVYVTTEFTEDTDVYAVMNPDAISVTPAAMVVNGEKKPLEENLTPDTEKFPTLVKEYMLMGVDLTEEQTATFELRVDGELVALPGRLFVDENSEGIDISVTTAPVTAITVLRSGLYNVYLKLWTSGDYSIYASDGNGIIEPDIDPDIPTIVLKHGTETVAAKRSAPGEDDSAIYQVKFTAELTANEEVSFTVDGEALADFYLNGCQSGCDCPAGAPHVAGKAAVTPVDAHTAKFTTLADGYYTFYFKYYGPNNYTVWAETPEKTGPIIPVDPENPQAGDPDPNPPAPAYADATVTVGDETMTNATATVDRGWKVDATKPDGGYYDNHTLSDQFMATLNITAETTYSFTLDGTALDDLWIEHHKDIQVKVGATLGAAGGANGASFTLVAGDYTVYLKKYSDGGFTVWIQGTQTGSFGEIEEPEKPTAPDRVFENAVVKVGDTTMTDDTASVDRGTVANPLNATLTDQFKATLTLTQQQDFTLSINGTKVTSMWIKHHANVKVMVDGVLVPTENVGDGGARGSKFILPAGTYNLYLQNYSPAGDDLVLWIEGKSTAEIVKPVTDTIDLYLAGESARLGLAWKTISDPDDIPAAIHFTTEDGVSYKLEVELDVGAKFQILTAGQGWNGQIGFSSLTVTNSEFKKNDTNNIETVTDGKYEIIYNTETKKVTYTRLGDVSALAMKFDVYIHGSFVTSWASKLLQANVAGGTTIEVTYELTANLEFGIKTTPSDKTNQTGWGAKDQFTDQTGGKVVIKGNNLSCNTAGTYKFKITIDDTGAVTSIVVSVA